MTETNTNGAPPLTTTSRLINGFVRLFTTGFFLFALWFGLQRDTLKFLGLGWRVAQSINEVADPAIICTTSAWAVGALALGVVRLVRGAGEEDLRDPWTRWVRWLQHAGARRRVLAAIGGAGALLVGAGFLLGVNRDDEVTFAAFIAVEVAVAVAAILRLTRRKAPLGARVELGAPSPVAHRVPMALLVTSLAAVAALTQTNLSGRAFFSVVLFYISTLAIGFAVGTFVPDAEIGADGVYVRGLRPRFVPFRGTEMVEKFGWGVAIRRDGNVVLRLRVRDRRDIARRTDLVTRIEAAVVSAANRAQPTAMALEAHAARLAGDAHEAGYRIGSGRREELWQLVEGTNVPTKLRVDAARELAIDGSASDIERLHAAAEAIAEPDVRETLFATTTRS